MQFETGHDVERRADHTVRNAERGERTTEARDLAKPRRTWVDAAKGVGIFLVVLGHTERGLVSAQILPSGGAVSFVDRFIYALHMPLFFFLSGLFLLPRVEQRYPQFAFRQIVRLGYPYLIWASLQTLVQITLSKYTNRPVPLSELWAIAFVPPMQFWFLYALLLQALFIGGLSALRVDTRWIFGIAAALFASAPYLPIGSWLPIYQAREALVFTALGVLVGVPGRLQFVESLRARTYALGATLGFAVVVVIVARQLEQQRLAALIAAGCGTVATLCVCCLLARVERPLLGALRAHLVKLGTASLAIFVAHTLASAAVRIGLQKVAHVEDATAHMVLGMLAGLYAPLVLLILAERWKVPYVFEWPLRRPAPPRRATRWSTHVGAEARTSARGAA